MIGRIWTAYRVEIEKAVRQKSTYAGPALVLCAVGATLLMRPIAAEGPSSYAFVGCATRLALDLLGLLLVLTYCAGLLSSELASGTIRVVLVRPLRRWEFVAAKLLLGLSYAVLLLLVTAGASWGAAFALGELAGVSYGGELQFTAQQMHRAYLLGMALALAPTFAAVAYALFFSALTRNTAAAVSLSVGLWLAVDIVKHPLGLAPYLFTSYFETPWRVFSDRCDALNPAWAPAAQQCLLASVPAGVLFAAAACLILSRRNLSA